MKRAILKITDQLLVEMFKAFNKMDDQWRVFRVLENPLPDDAKPIRCGFDEQGTLMLVIESDEFDFIEEGYTYPTLEPVIFQVQTGKDQVDKVIYE